MHGISCNAVLQNHLILVQLFVVTIASDSAISMLICKPAEDVLQHQHPVYTLVQCAGHNWQQCVATSLLGS